MLKSQIARYRRTLMQSARVRGVQTPIDEIRAPRLPTGFCPTTNFHDNPANRLPCEHEGPVINYCGCSGSHAELRHIRHCLNPLLDDVVDTCNRDHPSPPPGSQKCSSCPLYTPLKKDVSGLRHLIYHIYPLKGRRWRWNLRKLSEYRSLFTGKKVFAVALDEHTDTLEEVRSEIESCNIEISDIFTVPNTLLGEVETWEGLWSRILPAGPGDLAFYAHAKGVTRPMGPNDTTLKWTEILYEANLGHFPRVQELLQVYPLAGAFKKVGKGMAGSPSLWHYSGTFFWSRCEDVSSKKIEAERIWAGTEAWPGVVFHEREGGCIFCVGKVPQLNLYSLPFMRKTIIPSWEKWKSENAHYRNTISLPVIGGQ